MKKDFKVGDKVVRINSDNGGCARVGQQATVVAPFNGCVVYVSYPGQSHEGWFPENMKLLASGPVFAVGDKGQTSKDESYEVVLVDERLRKPLRVILGDSPHLTGFDATGFSSTRGRLLKPLRIVYANFYNEGKAYHYSTAEKARIAAGSNALLVAYPVAIPE
jgi:hypothetical protein